MGACLTSKRALCIVAGIRNGCLNMAGYIRIALACIFWGVAWPLSRYSVEHIGPFLTGEFRFSLAFVFFLPFLFYPKPVKISLKSAAFLVPLGLTGFYLNNVASYLGLQYTTATTASIIVMSNPLNIAVLSYIFLKDRINAIGALSIILSVAGALTVVVRGDFSSIIKMDVNIGNILIVFTTISWSVYSILIKLFENHVMSIENITFGSLIASLGFLPLCLGSSGVVPMPVSAAAGHFPWVLIGVLVFLSLFNTNLAFYFWSEGIKYANPNTAAIFFGLIPLSAAITENIMYGESLAGYHVIGGLLIFTGIVLFMATKRNGIIAGNTQKAE